MKPLSFFTLCVLIGFAATQPFSLQAADDSDSNSTTASVKFTDPSKPGFVKIYVARGDLRVRAGTSADTVTVVSDASPRNPDGKRADGLRVISSSNGFSLTEKENVVTLEYGRDAAAENDSDFQVTLPPAASLEIVNGWGGDVSIESVRGDVEVKTMNGQITLTGLGGGAVVETMNGEIKAAFATFTGTKPLSFTSMNGEINLNLPVDAKANVRLRTHNGAILTDFPEDALKTKSEPVTNSQAAEIGRMAAVVAKETAAAAKQAVQEVRAALQEAANDLSDKEPRTPKAPVPPRPPRPPRHGTSIPALAGGKVVTGTLNGGGPEIQVTTMNGNIVVRKSLK
jgi:hypothetical protein